MRAESTQFVLINLSRIAEATPVIGAGKNSLSLHTLELGLNQRGFHNVHLLPTEDCVLGPKHNNISYLSGLASIADSTKRLVIGLSAMTCDANLLADSVKYLRQEYPEAILFGGGQFFKRENITLSSGRRLIDPVEYGLSHLGLNAVAVGYGGSLVDFAERFNGDYSAVKSPGYYYRDLSGNIQGFGRGVYTPLPSIPYVVNGTSINIVLDDTCKNGCWYCSSGNNGLGSSKEKIAKVFRELYTRFPDIPTELDINDVNSFEPDNPNSLLPILDELDIDHRYSFSPMLKSCNIDPSLLTTGLPRGSLGAFVGNLVRHGFTYFFMGVEVLDGKAARKIGANYHKKPKKEEELKAQISRIFDFIFLLKTIKKTLGYPPVPFRLKLSFIMHDETLQSTHRLIKLMEELRSQSDENVKVDIRFSPLTPYPGTIIRRLYKDAIIDPDNFGMLDLKHNVWDTSVFPGSIYGQYLIEAHNYYKHLIELNLVEPSYPDYFNSLRVAANLAYERISRR